MYKDKKVVVVMPAYNAEQTLEKTHAEVMAQGVVDLVVVADDASRDSTTTIAKNLHNTKVYTHQKNLGYVANQRLCYRLAIEEGDDFVFDNQMLAQIVWFGYTIAEVSCPTKYFSEASSINLPHSIKYGPGCMLTALTFRLAKTTRIYSTLFPENKQLS